MTDAIYHERLVALARAADGKGALENPDGRASLDNPLCGDRVTVEVTLDGSRVGRIAHKVRGCILCEAAAAAVGRHAPGADLRGLKAVIDGVAAMLVNDPPPPPAWPELAHFAPVRPIKSRHRCVTMPFEALERAVDEAVKKAGAKKPG